MMRSAPLESEVRLDRRVEKWLAKPCHLPQLLSKRLACLEATLMTKEEHLLMISLFTKQAQFIKIILEILKSRGIVEHDDPAAFESAVRLDLDSNAALFQQTKAGYVRVAKGLGIEAGLGSS